MHFKHLTASVSVGIVVQPVEPEAEMVEVEPPRAQHPDPVVSINLNSTTARVSDTA